MRNYEYLIYRSTAGVIDGQINKEIFIRSLIFWKI